MVVNNILLRPSQYSSRSVSKCWKETVEDAIYYSQVHAHSDKVDLLIRFLKVIRVQGTVVASSIA